MNKLDIIRRYMTTKEAAEFIGVSPTTLNAWRMKKTGPPYVRIGALVRYRAEDIDQWANSRVELVQ
jgi:excisionase family DNA binding protein